MVIFFGGVEVAGHNPSNEFLHLGLLELCSLIWSEGSLIDGASPS